MNIENKLDELKQLNAVDAPPFLMMRIKQAIQNKNLALAPATLKWAFALAATIIIIINCFMLFYQTNSYSQPGIEAIVTSMKLTESNELYHEQN